MSESREFHLLFLKRENCSQDFQVCNLYVVSQNQKYKVFFESAFFYLLWHYLSAHITQPSSFQSDFFLFHHLRYCVIRPSSGVTSLRSNLKESVYHHDYDTLALDGDRYGQIYLPFHGYSLLLRPGVYGFLIRPVVTPVVLGTAGYQQ